MISEYGHAAHTAFMKCFMRMINLGEYERYVSDVVLANENHKDGWVMSTAPDTSMPGKSIITVYPKALLIRPFPFFNIMKHHEGRHAQQNAEGRKPPADPAGYAVWHIERELDALHNERLNANSPNIPKDYIESIEISVLDYTEKLAAWRNYSEPESVHDFFDRRLDVCKAACGLGYDRLAD